MKPLGIGIVGLSAKRGWAATSHVPALKHLEDVEIRAVTGSSLEAAALTAREFGIPNAFDDPAEMAARDDIDLIVVAVKVPLHKELVEIAINAGKAVYCEWPLARNLQEAKALAALAQSKGVRGFVGLQGRAAPAARFIKDLVTGGLVGDVLSTTLIGSGGGWRATVAADKAYLFDRSNGATLLSIPVGHAADVIGFCLGQFETVSSLLDVRRPTIKIAPSGETIGVSSSDQVVIAGVLAGGAVANIHYRSGIASGTGLHWEINGTEGSLIVTGASGHLQYGDVTIHHLKPNACERALLSVPETYRRLGLNLSPYTEAVRYNYADVVTDLREGRSLAPSFGDALVRHAFIDAVERSAATGQRQACVPGISSSP